jgi:hypothetical protein
MSWIGLWECDQCGHPNNEGDVFQFQVEGVKHIQCKECPNTVKEADVPLLEIYFEEEDGEFVEKMRISKITDNVKHH